MGLTVGEVWVVRFNQGSDSDGMTTTIITYTSLIPLFQPHSFHLSLLLQQIELCL